MATRGELARSGPFRTAQKRRIVLDLRAAGLTFEQIAEQMKAEGWSISASGAAQIVNKALQAMIDQDHESVEKIRALDLQRIDRALQVLYPKVREGNLKAMREYRAFIELRSKLLGTFAPQKLEVKGQIEGALSAEDREEIRRLEEAFQSSAPPEIHDAEVVEDDVPAELPREIPVLADPADRRPPPPPPSTIPDPLE